MQFIDLRCPVLSRRGAPRALFDLSGERCGAMPFITGSPLFSLIFFGSLGGFSPVTRTRPARGSWTQSTPRSRIVFQELFQCLYFGHFLLRVFSEFIENGFRVALEFWGEFCFDLF